MTTIRPFEPNDLFRFNNVNLDPLTETYGLPFYMQYLITWPEFFHVAEHPNGQIMGYIMGKAEGRDQEWHGHVTAVTVAAEFRRMGLAAKFMKLLEETSEEKHCFFVDLFVRVSNRAAIKMYENLGYTVFRQITDYYSSIDGSTDEDAYDMRKALCWDVRRRSIIPLKTPIHFSEVEEAH